MEEKRAHLTEKMAGLKELLIQTGAEIEENVPMGKYTSFQGRRPGGRGCMRRI